MYARMNERIGFADAQALSPMAGDNCLLLCGFLLAIGMRFSRSTFDAIDRLDHFERTKTRRGTPIWFVAALSRIAHGFSDIDRTQWELASTPAD